MSDRGWKWGIGVDVRDNKVVVITAMEVFLLPN